MPAREATLQQVADRAGVSIATVSRVANGTGQVSEPTRRRVAAAIEELGFRPSHFGRALVSRRHGAVGVVLPGLSGPYHHEVIAGFEQAAVEARLAVLILGTHLLEGSADRVLDLAARVDGMVVLGGSLVEEAVVDRLADRGFPVVLMAGAAHARATTVRAESFGAVRRLTRHLVADHGYDRLAFLGNPTGSPDAAERWAGYLAGRSDCGLPADEAPVPCHHDQPGGMVAAAELLGRPDRPRALVCVNDETALGVLVYALGQGVSVPAELALTGFDSLPASVLTRPAITSVRQPMRELGRRTLEELRLTIDEVESGQPATGPRDVVLPTEVVLRGSCGCPPGDTQS
ncbi:MAG: LacI family DNA-binding transcriptional regulator [Nocardioidaceae bacterium]